MYNTHTITLQTMLNIKFTSSLNVCDAKMIERYIYLYEEQVFDTKHIVGCPTIKSTEICSPVTMHSTNKLKYKMKSWNVSDFASIMLCPHVLHAQASYGRRADRYALYV